MAAKLPAMSATVARLLDPTIHLAAYDGVVSPWALIIESPIIILTCQVGQECLDFWNPHL